MLKNSIISVRNVLHGHCFIPFNKRNSKNRTLTDDGYIVCKADIKMIKDGKQYLMVSLSKKLFAISAILKMIQFA